MSSSRSNNRTWMIPGLGIALLVAIFLSPFASSNPDGLDRVSQDHKFVNKALKDTPAKKLPFYHLFNEYTLRGTPKPLATPLAGLAGTLVTFGLAWGVGKLVVRGQQSLPKDG